MRVSALLLLLVAAISISRTSADFRDRYKEGKFEEALTELEQSPEAAQKGYSYYLNRGLIHHALNQEGLAVAYLTKAKVLDPYGGRDVGAPLADSTAGLVKWLGLSRIDATSYPWETLGDLLPLDVVFLVFGVIAALLGLGYFFFAKQRPFFMRTGSITLGLAVLFGVWSTWNDQHPLMIVTESRLAKSGPGESFLDRGAVEVGMKLRIVGELTADPTPGGAPPEKWWKIRVNDHHDLGFLPERSGLLLTDESNTPGT